MSQEEAVWFWVVSRMFPNVTIDQQIMVYDMLAVMNTYPRDEPEADKEQEMPTRCRQQWPGRLDCSDLAAIGNAERTYDETRARQAGQIQPKLDRIIFLCDFATPNTPLMSHETEEIRGLALDLKLLTQEQS